VTDIHVYTVILATNAPLTVIGSRILGVKQPPLVFLASISVLTGIYLVVFQGLVPDL